jgi:hypothetical protein
MPKKHPKVKVIKAWANVGSNGLPFYTAQAGWDRKKCTGRYHIYLTEELARAGHLGEPIIPVSIHLPTRKKSKK